VQAELAQVETELAAAQEKMAAYLKELGLWRTNKNLKKKKIH
jgi:hypothetical protein